MYLSETYSKVCIGKDLSDSFSIQNGLKQEDSLPPLLFNFGHISFWLMLMTGFL
jgi:hypothetical protein